MPKNSWPELSWAATQALRTPDIKRRYDGFLHFVYEPSFGDAFSLTLIWENGVCRWRRLYWNSAEDSAKFGVLEELRYLGQTLAPTLIASEGILSVDVFEALRALLGSQSLPIGPFEGRLILDGVQYTLTIDNGTSGVTYRWQVLPEAWAGLEKVTLMLFEMNDNFGA